MFETFLIFPFGHAEKDAERAREQASGIPTSAGISPCCCWHVEYFRENSRYLRNCFVLPPHRGRANLTFGFSMLYRLKSQAIGMNNFPSYRREKKNIFAKILRSLMSSITCDGNFNLLTPGVLA